MGRVRSQGDTIETVKRRPGLTPESRENQVISMAMDLAEKMMANGTASSQVITHFLKQGSPKAKKEMEILEKQSQLIDAKIESIRSLQGMDTMYKEALDAMRSYSGGGDTSAD